nr:uncharacterized protein LOC128685605 [Cherax quadricarinatus]
MDKIGEWQVDKYARTTAHGRDWETVKNSATRPLLLILTKMAVMFSGLGIPAAEEKCVRCLQALQAFLIKPDISPALLPQTSLNSNTLANTPSLLYTHNDGLSVSHNLTKTVIPPHSLPEAANSLSGTQSAICVSTPVEGHFDSLPDASQFVGDKTVSLPPACQPHTFPTLSPSGLQPILPASLPSQLQPLTLAPNHFSVPSVTASILSESSAGHLDHFASSLPSSPVISSLIPGSSTLSTTTHTLTSCTSMSEVVEASDLHAGGKMKLTQHEIPITEGDDRDILECEPNTQDRRDSDIQQCDSDTRNIVSDTQDLEVAVITLPDSAGHSPALVSGAHSTAIQNAEDGPVLQNTVHSSISQSSSHASIPESIICSLVGVNADNASKVASLGPSPTLEQLVKAVLEDPSLPDLVDAVHKVISNM